MASDWSPEDFIAPFGLFRPAMFPLELDLNAKISTYVDEAEERAGNFSGELLDNAVEAWVYYKGFLAAHVDYNIDPSINTLSDQGSEEFTFSQIQQWKVLSDEYRARFESLLLQNSGSIRGSITQAVPTQIGW